MIAPKRCERCGGASSSKQAFWADIARVVSPSWDWDLHPVRDPGNHYCGPRTHQWGRPQLATIGRYRILRVSARAGWARSRSEQEHPRRR